MNTAVFSDALLKKIDTVRGYFPSNYPRSPILMSLRYIQDELGYISAETIVALADYLGVTVTNVEEIVAFYHMYRTDPVGNICIKVCMGLPCALKGSQELLESFVKRLEIGENGHSPDAQKTVQTTSCLAHCTQAPVILINDHNIVSIPTQEAFELCMQSFIESPV